MGDYENLSDEQLRAYYESVRSKRWPLLDSPDSTPGADLVVWLLMLVGAGALVVAFIQGVDMVTGMLVAVGAVAGWKWYAKHRHMEYLLHEFHRCRAEMERRHLFYQ